MEVAKAPESRLEMLEASDLEFSWILQMITSFFIVYIVYSLLEHYSYINMGWKEAWIKTCDGLVLLESTKQKL